MAAADSNVFGLRNCASVTPSDGTDLTQQSRALYIGSGGNLAVVTASGQTVVFVNVLGGTWLPITVNRVLSTNTSAANILALW